MNLLNKVLWIFLCLFFSIPTQAQKTVEVRQQTIRGYIVDRATGNGISNAYVELLNHQPGIAVFSDENGLFELLNCPLGRQRIRVDLDGYYETIYEEFVVAGKQAVITIGLEQEIRNPLIVASEGTDEREDKKRLRNPKMESIDEMNAISTQAFNTEEVKRYVSGFGDPARVVTNFPGMFNMNDFQNFIVSRGNSPYGIKWLIDGIPVENPQHFAIMGYTGGTFPLVNNSLLTNSDFVSGALSAQYGNAFSGVFDAQLRKGNNQAHEFSVELSTFGVEATAEGPLKKGKSSYLVAVRAGLFDFINDVGLNIGTNSIPRYYDFNIKFDFTTEKAGSFSFFAIGGISKVDYFSEGRDISDIYARDGIDINLEANKGIVGLTNKKFFSTKTSLKTTLSYLITDYNSYEDTIVQNVKQPYYNAKRFYQRIGLSTTLNTKVSSQLLIRTGLYAYTTFYDLWDHFLDRDETTLIAKEIQTLMGGFAQMQYKFSEKFVLNIGLQAMYWTLNNKSWSAEPRLALNWYVGRRHKLSLGYGWHSKIQTTALTFLVKKRPNGTYDKSNRELGPTRSHQLVLSYETYLAKFWGLKANIYGQYNTNVAVEDKPSSLSIANYGAIDPYPRLASWENTGLGYNYGLEMSIEKFFKGYYGLLSGTYQRASYQGSDLIWRKSAFDIRYISSLLMGRDFLIGKKKRNVFYVDIRFNIHGGLPYTPIDLEASKALGTEVLMMDKAYTERLGVYKRLDLRIGARFNHRGVKISHHVYLEILNIANFQNDLQVKYDPDTEAIIRTNQFGLFPNLFYQIQF